jgi:hypothetical protein
VNASNAQQFETGLKIRKDNMAGRSALQFPLEELATPVAAFAASKERTQMNEDSTASHEEIGLPARQED